MTFLRIDGIVGGCSNSNKYRTWLFPIFNYRNVDVWHRDEEPDDQQRDLHRCKLRWYTFFTINRTSSLNTYSEIMLGMEITHVDILSIYVYVLGKIRNKLYIFNISVLKICNVNEMK